MKKKVASRLSEKSGHHDLGSKHISGFLRPALCGIPEGDKACHRQLESPGSEELVVFSNLTGDLLLVLYLLQIAVYLLEKSV